MKTDLQQLREIFGSGVFEPKAQADAVTLFELESEAVFSFLCEASGIQDVFRFRAQHRAKCIARFLIDGKGKFKREATALVIKICEKNIFYPNGEKDQLIFEHVIKVLKFPSLVRLVEKFSVPVCHKWAERLIRDTLGLDDSIKLENRHARTAALAAVLCPLRQNIGSCFATAPAILIQENHIDKLFADLYELLSIGRLKRVFGGVEYSVPLSLSTGMGDLRRPMSEETACFCPGIIQGFVRSGHIPPLIPLKEKIERTKSLLYLQTGMSVEDVFYHSILRHHKITPEQYAQNLKKHLMYSYNPYNVSISSKSENTIREIQNEIGLAKGAFKAITDNPLLKAWEYTLASFSEVKMEFSKWNLYSSLGLHPEEKGGIGEVVLKYIQVRLEECNRKIVEYQHEYENAFHQLKSVEAQSKNQSGVSDAYLRAQHTASYHHMQICLDLRDKFNLKGNQLANFINFMIEKYSEQFKEYFQELYDAEMQEFKGGLYDDEPAGFRLVYKHGRSDATLWTFIHNEDEWIEALIDFFKKAEPALTTVESMQEDVFHVTSIIIHHLRTKEFLESALARSKNKKPWAYVSGGTMETLIKTYARREGALTEEKRKIEDETDLLTFVIDTLKGLPPKITDGPTGMLMYSPTHAFILRPQYSLFRKAWHDSGFTYTWIRDQFIEPRQNFYGGIVLAASEQKKILEAFLKTLAPFDANRIARSIAPMSGHITIGEFKDIVVDALHGAYKVNPHKETLFDQLDSVLYQSFPFQPALLFADTNWSRDYFAFVVNPASGALELWRTDYTGMRGQPLSIWKHYLTQKHTWGIYTMPYEYGI